MRNGELPMPVIYMLGLQWAWYEGLRRHTSWLEEFEWLTGIRTDRPESETHHKRKET